MTTPAGQSAVVNEPVVNEEVWRAWIQKGKLEERVSMRKLKLGAGLLLVLLTAGAMFIAGK